MMERYSTEIPNLLVMNKTLKVHTFNLPPGPPSKGGSCLACSPWCAKNGFCQHGRWNLPSVRQALELRYQVVARHFSNWRRRFTAECDRQEMVRIHSTGDFFDPEYILNWEAIVRDCHDTLFAAYTKTWQLALKIPIWAQALNALGSRKNMTLWLSTDESLPDPSELPRLAEVLPDVKIRVAYLEGSHPKARKVNCLKQLRKDVNCYYCQLCWSPRRSRVTFRQH